MVLPLAVLLAYCSGPNNTQTTTDTDMNGTSSSVSASTTGTTTDVSDVNTSTESGVSATTGTTSAAITGTGTISTTQDGTDAHKADIIASASASNSNNTVNIDPSDPMYQHFQRVNGQSWTWDMNYPGYDRPTAGTYNSAVNGNWQLVMTPELVSAWRGDNSRSLWSSGYAYDGRYLGGNTYLSASESFNTRSNDLNGSASVQVNGSSNAGTLSSSSTSSTSSLNNNASANSSITNQMNGNTSTANTTDQPISGTSATTGTTAAAITGNGSATTETTSSSVSGSTSVNASSSATVSGTTSSTLNGSTANMDVNSVNYNAANGNLYQMPKFNLYLDNGSFTGYTGCNSVSGRVSVSGNSLRFLNTEPSTSIDCLGGLDQTVLLDLLRRVDSYSYVGDELQLMQGNQVLLRFKKGGSASGLQ